MYLDEKHLIENSGRDQEWTDDPVSRPHAPLPYDHEDTVLVPDYDYSFMQPQEIEQMYSIQSFFNNSLVSSATLFLELQFTLPNWDTS